MSPLSPAKLRVIGLGAAVTIAVLLPIVAVAGPSDTGAGRERAAAGAEPAGAEPGDAKPGDAKPAGTEPGDAKPGDASGAGGAGALADGLLGGLGVDTPEAPGPEAPEVRTSPRPESFAPGSPATPAVPARVTRCGPELASPDGVEAQTCVLAEGRDVWARTYYRNATGRELDAFLTLMGPAGRTVRVSCAVLAQDEPGTCETPRERGRGVARSYTAVAEFAGTGEGGDTPLLLRAGSNSADAEAS